MRCTDSAMVSQELPMGPATQVAQRDTLVSAGFFAGPCTFFACGEPERREEYCRVLSNVLQPRACIILAPLFVQTRQARPARCAAPSYGAHE
jgi:hypothetical protein